MLPGEVDERELRCLKLGVKCERDAFLVFAVFQAQCCGCFPRMCLMSTKPY